MDDGEGERVKRKAVVEGLRRRVDREEDGDREEVDREERDSVDMGVDREDLSL
jgi:hypothetical protein